MARGGQGRKDALVPSRKVEWGWNRSKENFPHSPLAGGAEMGHHKTIEIALAPDITLHIHQQASHHMDHRIRRRQTVFGRFILEVTSNLFLDL